MQILRNSLTVALLLVATVVGLQVSFLLAQAGSVLNDLHDSTAEALANADRTLVIIRETAEQQRGSYDTIARSTARSLSGLAQLIEHTDEHLETLAPAAQDTFTRAGTAVAAIGENSEILLQTTNDAVQRVERLTANPALEIAAASMARSAENMERMTAAAADSAAAVRDMLSPKKKSFWRRLLERMIPRPTIGIAH